MDLIIFLFFILSPPSLPPSLPPSPADPQDPLPPHRQVPRLPPLPTHLSPPSLPPLSLLFGCGRLTHPFLPPSLPPSLPADPRDPLPPHRQVPGLPPLPSRRTRPLPVEQRESSQHWLSLPAARQVRPLFLPPPLSCLPSCPPRQARHSDTHIYPLPTTSPKIHLSPHPSSLPPSLSVILPLIYGPLYRNSADHWNATVEGLAQNVLKM